MDVRRLNLISNKHTSLGPYCPIVDGRINNVSFSMRLDVQAVKTLAPIRVSYAIGPELFSCDAGAKPLLYFTPHMVAIEIASVQVAHTLTFLRAAMSLQQQCATL